MDDIVGRLNDYKIQDVPLFMSVLILMLDKRHAMEKLVELDRLRWNLNMDVIISSYD